MKNIHLLQVADNCNLDLDFTFPCMTERLAENSLLMAVNKLTNYCVIDRGQYPEAFDLYVSPYLTRSAESILRYPQTLQLLNLLERGLFCDIYACHNVSDTAPNLRWGLRDRATEITVVSSGTTPPSEIKREIMYTVPYRND